MLKVVFVGDKSLEFFVYILGNTLLLDGIRAKAVRIKDGEPLVYEMEIPIGRDMEFLFIMDRRFKDFFGEYQNIFQDSDEIGREGKRFKYPLRGKGFYPKALGAFCGILGIPRLRTCEEIIKRMGWEKELFEKAYEECRKMVIT